MARYYVSHLWGDEEHGEFYNAASAEEAEQMHRDANEPYNLQCVEVELDDSPENDMPG